MSLYVVRTVMTGNGCSKWTILNKVCEDITSQFPDIGEVKRIQSKSAFQRIIKAFNRNLILQEESRYVSLISGVSRRNTKRSESLGVTLSIGQPDYQPTMLLERALRSSAAVCRLTRSFQIEDLEDLIGKLQPIAYPEICKVLENFLAIPKGFLVQEGFSSFSEIFNAPKIQDQLLLNSGKSISIPYATGFLVGRNYLLTNHHVIDETQKSSIESFRAQFRYERSFSEHKIEPIEYKLDSSFCISDPDLDFALLTLKNFTTDVHLSKEEQSSLTISEQSKALRKIKDNQLRKAKLAFEKAGDNFGWLWMNPDHIIAPPIHRRWIRRHLNQLEQAGIEPKFINKLRLEGCLGEQVCIIQHPRGREKEIVLFNNRVTEISENSLLYEADADFGSSGSPILNTEFQLVGIHSGAIIQYSKTEGLNVQANLGTQVQSIVNSLKARHSSDPDTQQKLSHFIDNYIDISEKCKQSRIFLFGGRERGYEGEVALTRAITKSVLELSQGSQFKVIDVAASIPEEFRQQKQEELAGMPQSRIDLKTAIAWINSSSEQEDERYQPGDIALELLTDRYANPPQSPEEADDLPRGFKAYYIASNRERRSHAELLLDKLLTDIPNSVSCGARSDTVTQPRKLAFCRDIYMPSLVLYLGFLENEQDREVLGLQSERDFLNDERITAIAKSLYSGLISWSKVLSPINFWAE